MRTAGGTDTASSSQQVLATADDLFYVILGDLWLVYTKWGRRIGRIHARNGV